MKVEIVLTVYKICTFLPLCMCIHRLLSFIYSPYSLFIQTTQLLILEQLIVFTPFFLLQEIQESFPLLLDKFSWNLDTKVMPYTVGGHTLFRLHNTNMVIM
jgi:hypothetical protein